MSVSSVYSSASEIFFKSLRESLDEALNKVKTEAEKSVQEEHNQLKSTINHLRDVLEDLAEAEQNALMRAEIAEEQVRQLKKEVEQLHLADRIAREATQRAEVAEKRITAAIVAGWL